MNKYLFFCATLCWLLNAGQGAADDLAVPIAPNVEMDVNTPPPVAVPAQSGLIWSSKTVPPTPTSAIAEAATEALDNSFSLTGDWPLNELAGYLTIDIKIPVWLDERAVKFAKLDTTKPMLNFKGEDEALRTSLHRVLEPLGLQAVVVDEGLLITADHLALVRKGIGASKWLSLSDAADERIRSALDQPTSCSFSERKLSDVVAELSEQHNINLLIDRRALEEIGLTPDIPVTLSVNGVKLKSVLKYILRDFDLCYTVRNEVLWITTQEAAESDLLNRIYWLEGTGFPQDDMSNIMELIQSSISCDTWEALGGPSTMCPLSSNIRPAIVITTTHDVHDRIEAMIDGLREANLGPEPVVETVRVPQPGAVAPAGGGGGGFF